AGHSHGFHYMVGQQRTLAKVDIGFGGGSGYVRVRSQVNYRLVAIHGSFEPAQILDVSTLDAEPRVAQMSRVVPFATRGEIVVNGDRGHFRISQQPVHKMAADK